MNASCKLVVVSLAILMGVSTARGDELVIKPSVAQVVLDASKSTKVLLLFDISGLRAGEGRSIDNAFVDWRISGVPSDRRSEYKAYVMVSSWDTATMFGVNESEEHELATWTIWPQNYERNQGGVVRLDVRDAVVQWSSGSRANFGILVSTLDVSRAVIGQQLEHATLTITYGFRSAEEQ